MATTPTTRGARGEVAFETKADRAYARLKSWIQSGRLAPGQPLVLDELEATVGLDVSRMPLREALARLQADGLVQARPHRTARVAPLSRAEMHDIYAAREALEPMLARTAVTALGDGDALAAMEASLLAQQAALEDGDYAEFVRADRDFHGVLYELTGFHHSLRLVDHLRDISDRYVLAYASSGGHAHAGIHQHAGLLEACRMGDAEQVYRLTVDHVRDGVEVLSRAWASAPAGEITDQASRGGDGVASPALPMSGQGASRS